MAKTKNVDVVIDAGEEDTPVEQLATPNVLTVSVDNLFEISSAAAKVAGYYAGTTYEADLEEGQAILSKYGIAVG